MSYSGLNSILNTKLFGILSDDAHSIFVPTGNSLQYFSHENYFYIF